MTPPTVRRLRHAQLNAIVFRRHSAFRFNDPQARRLQFGGIGRSSPRNHARLRRPGRAVDPRGNLKELVDSRGSKSSRAAMLASSSTAMRGKRPDTENGNWGRRKIADIGGVTLATRVKKSQQARPESKMPRLYTRTRVSSGLRGEVGGQCADGSGRGLQPNTDRQPCQIPRQRSASTWRS